MVMTITSCLIVIFKPNVSQSSFNIIHQKREGKIDVTTFIKHEGLISGPYFSTDRTQILNPSARARAHTRPHTHVLWSICMYVHCPAVGGWLPRVCQLHMVTFVTHAIFVTHVIFPTRLPRHTLDISTPYTVARARTPPCQPSAQQYNNLEIYKLKPRRCNFPRAFQRITLNISRTSSSGHFIYPREFGEVDKRDWEGCINAGTCLGRGEERVRHARPG